MVLAHNVVDHIQHQLCSCLGHSKVFEVCGTDFRQIPELQTYEADVTEFDVVQKPAEEEGCCVPSDMPM